MEIGKQVLACILFNNNPWSYHLWYLQAFLYVLLIAIAINKYNLWKWIYGITPLLLIVAIIFGKYSEFVFGHPFYSFLSRNFLFVGLPCYAIGRYIRTNNIICRYKDRKTKLLILLITCVVLAYAESFIDIIGSGDLFVTTIPLSFLIIICTLSCNVRREGWLARIGRRDSLYIYIFHLLVADVLLYINSVYCLNLQSTSVRYILPLLVFLLTIGFIKMLRFLNCIH